MLTLKNVASRFTDAEVAVLDHLDGEVQIPVLAGPQAQGDVILLPWAADVDPARRARALSAAEFVGRAGVPVVRGENGGHTHLLVADGPVSWSPGIEGEQTLGTVVVPEGAAGYLLHPEHGGTGIAPGVYVARRQREQREQIELIAD